MKRRRPTVSIIIPVYNKEKYLKECLDSVLAQSFRDWEAILIDDGSTDGSGGIMSEYVDRDKRFKLVKQDNAGSCSARNRGLQLASGEYVIFLDSDDYWLPELLKKSVRKAAATGADIVTFNVRQLDNKTGVMSQGVLDFHKYLDEKAVVTKTKNADSLLLYASGLTCNKLYKHRLLVSNDLKFNTSLDRYEDVLFSALAQIFAKGGAVLDDPLYVYRVNNDESLSTVKYKHPLDVIDSMSLIEVALKVEGLDKKLARSFDNLIAENLVSSAVTMERYRGLQKVYPAFREFLFKKHHLDAYDKEYFLDESWYQIIQVMAKNDYVGFLRERLQTEKELVSFLSSENQRREERIQSDAIEIKRLGERLASCTKVTLRQLIKACLRRLSLKK